MNRPGQYHAVIDRACSTEPNGDATRKDACDEVVTAINQKSLSILDLAVLLAGPLTSPEKEARENGTRLLGEVVGRCRPVLGEGELHTLAEFLAARLRDWPCVGAAAAACRSLLQPPAPPAPGSAEGSGGGGWSLRDDSGLLVLEATAEMLRSAQSFRQDDRSSLLQLLLVAAEGRWGRLAAGGGGAGGPASGVALLDSFLGAADGEKDPRCLILAFEAVKALCGMHHSPGADVTPLRQLADEMADWASSYFPISFNPPPSLARGPAAISRADLASSLECALAASPFLAGGVLPLLVEKLSSTYRPAKEDSLAALRRCCPAYGPDALAPHLSQLWQALRAEVMAPGGQGGGGAAAALPPPPPLGGAGGAGGGAGGAGSEVESRLALAAAAAGCLTGVVRAAGPGAVDALALQDACMSDLVAVVRGAGSPTRGSSAPAVARADGQVLCGAMALAAISAAGPASLARADAAALRPIRAALAESFQPTTDVYDSRADQTLYGMTVLAAVVDAVAAELRLGSSGGGDGGAAAAARAWLVPSGDGLAALTEVKAALQAALAAVHSRVQSDDDDADQPSSSAAPASGGSTAVAMALDEATVPPPLQQRQTPPDPEPGCYSPAVAVQLVLTTVGVWGSLLRLHEAVAAATTTAGGGAAAAALQQLSLSSVELTAAAEQLCGCALAGAGVAGAAAEAEAPTPSRMRWGRRVDVTQEATAALQLLLALVQPQRPAAGGGADGERGAVVRLLMGRLAGAMAGCGGGGGGADAAGGVRAAALRLAVQLTQAPEQQALQVVADRGVDSGVDGSSGGGGAAAFTGALLRALPLLVLGQGSDGGYDEEWLLDCLTQLATRVLPPLASLVPRPPLGGPAPTPARGGAASLAAPQQPPSTPAAGIAAAAHDLVVAALTAAYKQWEAGYEGGAGRSVRDAAETEAAAAAAGGDGGDAGMPLAAAVTVTAGAGAAGECSLALLAAWCTAVQQLTASCDDRQQLDLAMEAADRIAACSARAVSDTAAAASTSATATAAAAAVASPSLSLSCAVVAGLRTGVLAAHSTQALADSLLRLQAAATKQPPVAAAAAELAFSAARGDQALATAAVALAAAVNRWPDVPSLDAWLDSAFRPALLKRLTAAAAADGTGAVAASVAAVRAVGWVGRALALRNHTALREVVEALVLCLRGESAPLEGARSAAPSTVRTTDMDVDGAADVEMETAAGSGSERRRGEELHDSTTAAASVAAAAASAAAAPTAALATEVAAATAAAAAAAADAFGVLVSEAAAVGGVALVARSPLALCRVLWQQRTYSLCVQALEAECHRHLQQQGQQGQQQGQQRPVVLRLSLPLHVAEAVARLAGSAPRQMCRNDAARLAPLLLRSVRTLCGALRSDPKEPPAAPAAAGAATAVTCRLSPSAAGSAAAALRGALAVVRDWLGGPKALPSAQLEKVLTDHVAELVDCVCAAAGVGTSAAHKSRTGGGPRAALSAGAAAAATRPAPAVAAAEEEAAVDAALAAAVREEALQCCSGLMDALPYHVLHPLRQQVLSCVQLALDDNRRTVRQLAVRARRVWGDT